MKITIIGGGNWGTTLAIMLSKKMDVTLWTIEKESIKNRENIKYLPGYKIPEEVKICFNLEESVVGAELIILALPTYAMREVIKKINLDKNTTLLSVAKGLEQGSFKRMSEVILEEKKIERERVCVLGGPTIAREIIKGLPTSCVLACEDKERAKELQKMMSSEKFRVYTEEDVIGVELGGAFKNVIAIAGGICDGLSLGINAKSALISRGIREIIRIGVKLGGKERTFQGLAGIGDLITTAFSKYSRNRKVGEEIGRGRKLDEVLKSMKEVAEGVFTVKEMVRIGKKYRVSLPITTEVYKILYQNLPPYLGVKSLMVRPLKEEGEEFEN
jgi:glycerol-3-phosphate dehydrogenase (NAD(P)+)